MEKDDALRAAKLEYLKNEKAARQIHFWAGLVIMEILQFAFRGKDYTGIIFLKAWRSCWQERRYIILKRRSRRKAEGAV